MNDIVEEKNREPEADASPQLTQLLSCRCVNWARTGQSFLTQHHPNCEKYNPEKDASELIKRLVTGIEDWAALEDGIPPEVWDAYTDAKVSIGEFNFDNSEAT